jgi:hypothetical protein
LVVLIILWKSTGYEAPGYAVFSNLISRHASKIEISSEPRSQTPSACEPPIMS